MNWIRRKVQPRLRAMALASIVLPVPGHVLDQEVAAAQQRDEREADLVVLADDDALDVGEDRVADLLDVAHRTPVVCGQTPRASRVRPVDAGGRYVR